MYKRYIYYAIVTVSFAIYAVSINSPLITVKKFLFFNDTVSLAQILTTLIKNGELLLGSIVFIFTIILPTIKFILLTAYGVNPEIEKIYPKSYQSLEYISKWAMLDVFIAALIVVIIKLDFLSSALTHYGLYLFMLSIFLSMICSHSRQFWISKTDV